MILEASWPMAAILTTTSHSLTIQAHNNQSLQDFAGTLVSHFHFLSSFLWHLYCDWVSVIGLLHQFSVMLKSLCCQTDCAQGATGTEIYLHMVHLSVIYLIQSGCSGVWGLGKSPYSHNHNIAISWAGRNIVSTSLSGDWTGNLPLIRLLSHSNLPLI